MHCHWLRAGKHYAALNYLDDLGATPRRGFCKLDQGTRNRVDRIPEFGSVVISAADVSASDAFDSVLSPWVLVQLACPHNLLLEPE